MQIIKGVSVVDVYMKAFDRHQSLGFIKAEQARVTSKLVRPATDTEKKQ